MYRERIARWIRTRRSRARFNELGASIPTQSSADCITTMPEFEFSAHTGGRSEKCQVHCSLAADLHHGKFLVHLREISIGRVLTCQILCER
jgi:hypothetical protein